MEQTKHLKDAVNDVRDTLEKARAETMDVATQALKKGEKAWGDIRRRGEDIIESAQQQGKDVLEDIKEESAEGLILARRYVKKNPGKAVGLALLAGVVLGALFFSSSSKDE